MAFGRVEEQVADWRCESQIDRGARVLRNIALTGRESKNGYRYTETALRNAARLYDHKPVFLDHADRPGGTAHRSTRDLVGSIINSRFEQGRIRSDVRVLDTESGRTFLALAEENTPGVGMSHVVLAHRSADGSMVEKIEDVLSVDVVVKPATTTTLRESNSPKGHKEQGLPSSPEVDGETALSTHKTAPDGRASSSSPWPDRLKPVGRCESTMVARLERLAEQVAELRSEFQKSEGPGATTAQGGVERGREAASSPAEGNDLDDLLSEARLPAFAVTDIFRETLMRAADEPARRRLLADRRELLEQAGRGRARSVERASESRDAGRAAFVAAIRGK